MHRGRRRRRRKNKKKMNKKNCEQPKHFPRHFGGSRYPRAYPFKFEEKHFRKNALVHFFFFLFLFSFSFLSLSLLRSAASSSSIQGSGAAGSPLTQKPEKCRSRRRKSLCVKRQVYGRAANPTLGTFRRESVEKDSGGGESGRGMIRPEKVSVGGRGRGKEEESTSE